MAAFLPFSPATAKGQAGLTVVLVTSSTPAFSASGAVTVLGENPSLLVTNAGATTAWVRLSNETTTVALSTVSVTDTPLAAGSVRLYASPTAIGTATVAVVATASGYQVFFTPGAGGLAP